MSMVCANNKAHLENQKTKKKKKLHNGRSFITIIIAFFEGMLSIANAVQTYMYTYTCIQVNAYMQTHIHM